MLNFIGRIAGTIAGHFFPLVVIGGSISVALMLLSVPKDTAGEIGLVVAIAVMYRYG